MNGFAIDAAAKASGRLAGFSVLESGSDGGAWNGVVSTTHRDTRGFAAVAQGFDSTREGHRELRIEGRGLDDLRTVVDSRAVFEHPGHTGC